MKDVHLSTDGIFYTLQGEGPLIGTPSIFIRFDRCNLRCMWGNTICDASYTSWKPGGESVEIYELIGRLGAVMDKTKCMNVVITGGEPALQADAVKRLARSIRFVGGHTTIETNGTYYIPNNGLDLICLSPKLSSSIPMGTKYENLHSRNRWKPDAIRKWMEQDYYFKFVIDREEDVVEVQALLEEVGQKLPDPEHVLFMPQGINAQELWERGRWVAEQCKRLGVRFTPRIQVDLWGNTPGT